jgi:hypothetical protein
MQMKFSRKMMALALMSLFVLMAANAYAQLAPGKMVVNLGDFGLSVPSQASQSASGEPGSAGIPLMNAAPVNNSSEINASINESLNNTMNESMINNTANIAPVSSEQISPASQAVPLIDLSGYSKDRRNKNLAGYKNIMYPIAEARGSTASASSGGGSGGCGGCG